MGNNGNNRQQLSVQLLHWEQAINRIAALDDVAAPEGWHRLERQTDTVIRATLQKTVRELHSEADQIRARFDSLSIDEASTRILSLRKDYLRTETVLDFFADAINSRTSDTTGRIMLGLDRLAVKGMRRLLEPLGQATPPVITYVDRGLGASILKSGLRLWDRRSINPVASIKIVRHNLSTATSLLHEIGHQVAHITGWNNQLRDALAAGLPAGINEVWSSWASEIAADAIAFVYAGHASLSALRNVIDGGSSHVFRFIPGDPHPIGMVRVLMVSDFAKHAFGRTEPDHRAPWNALERSWREKYPLTRAPGRVSVLIERSGPVLPHISNIVLNTRYQALGNRRLVDLVNPTMVSPAALDRFEFDAGPRAFELPYVARKDAIRLLALSGLRIATQAATGADYYEKQRRALLQLGVDALAA